MDEDWCHAVRTAAAATVACRLLARKGAATMAMLGAGDTARAAVPVMAKAFPLKEIRVTSRTPESRQNYAKEISQEYDLNIRPVDSTEDALKGADLVVSATTTSTPFVKAVGSAKGITVYSIGKHQEMESDVYKKVDKFVVDSWEHCKNKSDLQRMLKENFLSEKNLYAELPEILCWQKPGRQSDRERIFIRAIGLVNQDIAMADHIYRTALEKASERASRIKSRLTFFDWALHVPSRCSGRRNFDSLVNQNCDTYRLPRRWQSRFAIFTKP